MHPWLAWRGASRRDGRGDRLLIRCGQCERWREGGAACIQPGCVDHGPKTPQLLVDRGEGPLDPASAARESSACTCESPTYPAIAPDECLARA